MWLHLVLAGCLHAVSIAGSVLPKQSHANLLQASRRLSAAQTALEAKAGSANQPEKFFLTDAEQMDELPEYHQTQRAKSCHPKCVWNCGSSKCNTKCEPHCQAPKCITACKKVSVAKCKRVCKDPQCAVVCPPQCSHGTCPKCKTVCGDPKCTLECGRHQCESTCAQPDCAWDCQPDPVCAKPMCKMSCESTVCEFGKEQTLPSDREAPYLGQEIASRFLAKVPKEHLEGFTPAQFGKTGMMGTPKPMEGPKPLPKGGIKSITGETGITVEADVNGGVNNNQESPFGKKILAPGKLTDAKQLGLAK